MKTFILTSAFLLSLSTASAGTKSVECKSRGIFNKITVSLNLTDKTITYKSRYDLEVFAYLGATEDENFRKLVGEQKNENVFIQILFSKDTILKPEESYKNVDLMLTKINENGSTVSSYIEDMKCKTYAK